jgi:hypothetical protein
MTGIARFSVVALVAAPACLLQPDRVSAAPQTFQYQVEHPTYGNIGTYTNTVEQQGDKVDVQTQLHVSVKMLGIPLFHQDANREEHWEKGRLVSFQSTTDDNGKQIQINGKAQGSDFVVLSPLGTFTAPAQVHPSNPWAPQVLNTDTMMSTKTGRVIAVTVTDTGDNNVTFDGRTMKLRQYFIDGEKHQVVWLDATGVVIAFQTEEAGSRITFVLQHPSPSTEQRQASQ